MYNHRFLYVFILIFVFALPMKSQNILDFFTGVPDSSVLMLPKKDRAKIVKLSKNNRNARDAQAVIQKHGLFYTFEQVDIPNGYLKLIGAMEGHLEMCYWNLPNGRKLIAVYHEACGPGCSAESLDFYEWSAGKYKLIPVSAVFPDLDQKLFGVARDDDFALEFRIDFKETMTVKLPQKGKNIQIAWGSEEFTNENRNSMPGNSAKLIWKEGKFLIGEIFWAK